MLAERIIMSIQASSGNIPPMEFISAFVVNFITSHVIRPLRVGDGVHVLMHSELIKLIRQYYPLG